MRQTACVLILAAVATVACGRSVNVERERAALLQLDRDWSQTTNDLNKFVTFYADDASIYPPGMPVTTGSARIHDELSKMMATPGFSLRWQPVKASVSSAGDLGYTTGTYTMTVNGPDGAPMTEKGKYVEVWRRQARGPWKVIEDIFNADTPPPASVAAAPKPAAPAKAAKTAPKRPSPKRRR